MNPYLSGSKLYGDDFDIIKIKEWFDGEKEGFSGLIEKNDKYEDDYGYHNLNKMHGFSKIKTDNFENVLGFGSALGHEFYPIIDRIKNLHIIEPSQHLRNKKIGNIVPSYHSPNINGSINFSHNYFDLITCFGALHHISNVSFVLGELLRVLKPGGHLLLREPIVSLGDWNFPRRGLTKNERGIPVNILDSIFKNNNTKVISKIYFFTNTPTIERLFRHITKMPIYSFKFYILFDKLISKVFLFNYSYHPTRIIKKFTPSAVFYVISK